MRFSSIITIISTFVAAVSAAEFNISVGKDNANTFDPAEISGVQIGDVLRFRFLSKSHSVTQSTFDQPCQSKQGGVDSGFQPVDAGATSFPEFTIQINNVTAPLWFYCARAPHCTASGMVFAINPTGDKTFAAFQAKATGGASSSASASGSAASTASTARSSTGAGTATGSSGTTSATGATASGSGALAVSRSSAVTILAGVAVAVGLWL